MARSTLKNAPPKPRLWVPGSAYLDDERIVHLGEGVGYNGWGEDFRLAQCHFNALSSLKHRIWLVERASLDDELVDSMAIIRPHTLVDADTQPHAHRWLLEQPLLCVSGIKWERMIAEGKRVFCIEHGVEQPGLLRIQAAGGAQPNWSLRLDLDDFQQAIVQQLGGQPSVMAESLEARTALERLLRQLTRGVLTPQGIINALTARQLIEPGYGYHGATDGRAASVEQIEHSMLGIDALFAQVYQRADEQKLFARDMKEALRDLADDHGDVTVPVYGVAERVRLRELDVPLQDNSKAAPSWKVGNEPRSGLTLYETSVYRVMKAKLYNPKLDDALRARLSEKRPIASAPPGWMTRAFVVALLVIIAIALWQLR